MESNLPENQFSAPQGIQRKIWKTPEIVLIDIQSGNTPNGHEGAHTVLYNGITFTGVYFS